MISDDPLPAWATSRLWLTVKYKLEGDICDDPCQNCNE